MTLIADIPSADIPPVESSTIDERLDEQIAKLTAKREELAANREAASATYAAATLALHDAIDKTADDLEATRDLPDLVKSYVAACREYHRVVTGQILRRRKNFVVAGPEGNVHDPALD